MEFKKVIEINLNDEVRVKLTKEGIQELSRQHKDLRKFLLENSIRDIGEFVLILDDKGYYHTQLWSLIEKFSKHIQLGAATVFEGGNIYVTTSENSKGE